MPLKRPATMRESKRYIVFQAVSERPLEFAAVRDAIWDSVLSWLGENDSAKAGVRVIRNLWNPRDRTGFVQCRPRHVDSVKVALALVHQVGDSRVILRTLRVSGTIKSGREKGLPKARDGKSRTGKAGVRPRHRSPGSSSSSGSAASPSLPSGNS
jgi:RNase P/RNase MRP subunit POP5